MRCSRRGFWSRGVTFTDICVFNPLAPSYKSSSIQSLYKRFDAQRKNKYVERITEIEKGTFTPLVFSTIGGCGKEAQCFIKKLTEKIVIKQNCNISKAANLLKTKLSFCIIRSTVLCLRGSRSIKEQPTLDVEIDSVQARI